MKTIHFLFVLIFSWSTAEVRSQELRAFSISDLFNIRDFEGASVAPGGRYAAVIIERARKDRVVYSYRGFSFGRDLWLLDMASGAMERVLDGAPDSCSYWNPVWSPDGRHLAVLSTKGGDNVRAFVYNLANDRLTPVHENGVNLMTKTYQGARGFNDPYFWLDAEQLVVSLLPAGQAYNSFQMDHLPLKTITEQWRNTKYDIRSTASVLDSDSLHVYPGDRHSLLVRFHTQDNTIHPLDTGYFRHAGLSPSGELLFVVKRSGGTRLGEIDLIGSAWNFHHQAGIIDLQTGKKHYVPWQDLDAAATAGNNPHHWTSNSRYVAVRDATGRYPGCLAVSGNPFQRFESTGYARLEKEGQDLYLKSEQGWFRLNEKDGKPVYVPKLPDRSKELQIPFRGTELARDHHGPIVLSKYRDAHGLHLAINDSAQATQVFTLNSWISEVAPTEKELVKFRDAEGREQNALLLRSRHTPPKGLVVSCYPGTRIGQGALNRDYRYSDSFLNPLLFVANGYHVLIPTIDTKSTDEFKEFKGFVVPATEAVLQKEKLDPDKAAIVGLSHGGYLVYSVISQTQTFRSAISLAGYGNAFSQYGAFDIRYRYTNNPFENVGRLRSSESGYGGFGKPAYTDPGKYLQNSPALHTNNIRTPLLIIQGDKDFISIEQGEEMFTHLYRQGKRARFLRFWGEGHNINAPKNIERMWEEILWWLQETL